MTTKTLSRVLSIRLPIVAALVLGGAAALAASGTTTSPKMVAALEAVKADNIKTDVFWIASDERQGRDTPSDGLKESARYIRSRLERLGWKPGAKDGYFYTYKLEQRRIDEEGSTLVLDADGKQQTLQFGKDYHLTSSLDIVSSKTSGRVVFLGHGTKDEFDKASGLQGKWVVCFDGGEEPRDVARRAKREKAAGMLFGPGPDYKGEAYATRFAATLDRQRRGSVRWPESDKDTKSRGKAGDKDADKEKAKDKEPVDEFASVILTRASVEALLAAAQQSATPQFGSTLDVKVNETRKLAGQGGMIDVENVCGFWPGSDTRLAKEVILVTAHYDHLGTKNGVVYNGADDNGSGTCGLMSIAEALSQFGALRRSVMIMWVSGEEKGLWGSKAWSENPWLPEGHHAIADINIDMIGRNAPDMLLITPTAKRDKDYNGLVRLAEELSPLEGFPKLGSADAYYQRSDHYNFAKMGIPVAFLFSDVHDDYHQTTDDPDKIDIDKIRRVSRLVLRMLDGLQSDKLDLK